MIFNFMDEETEFQRLNHPSVVTHTVSGAVRIQLRALAWTQGCEGVGLEVC